MRFWNIILSLTFFSSLLNGHPIPDIPVIGSFDQNGSSVITVEIDTRSFADDPEEVPMLEWEAFNKLTEEEKENLLLRGKNMIQDTLLIRFNEKKWVLPSFDYNFEKKIGGNSVEEIDTFVIRGYAHRKLDSDINSYQIRAKESAEYDVIFTNRLNGIAQKRVNVLFPGEDSFILDLTNLFQAEEKNEISEPANFENKDSGGSQSTFFSFLRQGFVHVVPLG